MRALRHILALLACAFFFQSGHAVQIRRGPGSHIPESILPTDRDNPAVWSVPSSALTRSAAPGDYASRNVPRLGTQNYIVVLVDFTDCKFIIQDTDSLLKRYDRIFNEKGYTENTTYTHHGESYTPTPGCVSDYFRDQSNNQYNPVFKVIGPIHLSERYSYYGSDRSGRDRNVNVIVQEICDQLMQSDTLDFSAYLHSNSTPQLFFIFAGQGQNFAGADSNRLWPQSDTYKYNTGPYNIELLYGCTCELFWDSDSILDGIGTICHEFSHTLGLPDFYSGNEVEDAAMGYWSLMDYGSYENGGFTPVGYTAFEKYSLGWMELEEITVPGKYTLNDISRKPDSVAGIHTAYRLNTGLDNRFVILENHIQTGWYSFHRAEGLMVTAVDYKASTWDAGGAYVNLSRPYGFSILAADDNYNRESNAGDLFPYYGLDSITAVGSPNLYVSGSKTLYSVYGIERKNGLVSFIASESLPTTVSRHHDMQVSIAYIDGKLTVTAPTGSKVIVYDISGKPVMETTTGSETLQITLPGRGIWLVKCGNRTKKVSL